MGHDARFEAEVLTLLGQLKAKKEAVEERFKAEIAAIDLEIEAVSTTARLLRQSGSTAVPLVISRTSIIPDLGGRTIKQGCIEIARKNNGVVRVKEAKDALITAGVLRQTKNSWGVVNTTLMRSKEFEKHPTELGSYRLLQTVSKQAQLIA